MNYGILLLKSLLLVILCIGGKRVMDMEVKNEIMFYIQSELDREVDERQLLNMVIEEADCYVLCAYGQTLRFSKEDGDLIDR